MGLLLSEGSTGARGCISQVAYTYCWQVGAGKLIPLSWGLFLGLLECPNNIVADFSQRELWESHTLATFYWINALALTQGGEGQWDQLGGLLSHQLL